MSAAQRQIPLEVGELPTHWYNIIPDLPEPLPPPKDPEQGPSRVKQLPSLLTRECLAQEMSTERWIEIPEAVRELYL